jgi:hypothetical protein
MSLRRLRVLLWTVAALAGVAYLGLIFWTENRIHGQRRQALRTPPQPLRD